MAAAATAAMAMAIQQPHQINILGRPYAFAGGAEEGELLFPDRVEVVGDRVEVGLFAHVGYPQGVSPGRRGGKGERFGFPCCGGGFPENNRDP